MPYSNLITIESGKRGGKIIMNPRVKEVLPRKDHTLLIVFKNGETKLYDCKPLLNFGVFQELNDLNYFLMAKVERGTVVWSHEQESSAA